MSLLNKVTAKLPVFGDGTTYYLSLVITYKGVEAGLWFIDDNKLKITETIAVAFDANAKILDTAADAIDQICEKADLDIKDVILGLPDYWISQNQILPQYLDKLKGLAESLDITPFAFVAQNHSVVNRLKLHFGTTVSGFLLHADQNNFTLSSIQNGQIQQTRFIQQTATDTPETSLQKLFAHFVVNGGGTTIYAYSSVQLPYALDETIAKLGIFSSHRPQLIMLDNWYALQAVCLAGAIDRGKLHGLHIEDTSDSPVVAAVAPVVVLPVSAQPQIVAQEIPEKKIAQNDTATESSQWTPFAASPMPPVGLTPMNTEIASEKSNLEPTTQLPEGFTIGKDIAQEDSLQAAKTAEQPDQVTHAVASPATALHAVPQVPISSPMPFATAVGPVVHNTIPFQNGTVRPPAVQQVMPSDQKDIFGGNMDGKKKAGFSLPKIALLSGVFTKLKGFKKEHGPENAAAAPHRRLPIPKRAILFIVPVIIVASLFLGALFVSTATVAITFAPKALTGEMVVTASAKATQINAATKQIPVQTVTTEVSGDVKGVATGKKKVGEKARGSVSILNKTAQTKTFAKGTTLQADGAGSFLLTESVTVAGYSATDSADGQGQIIKFGKATGAAEANDIGPEGNIGTNTNLTVKGQSRDAVTATTAQAFTGGTAKDVTVISEQDIKRAEDDITKKLQQQAKTDVLSKVEAGKNTISDAIAVAISKKSTSKKVQDEAKDFTITATAKATAVVFNADDFKTLLTETVKDQLPTGFVLYAVDQTKQPTYKTTEKNGDIIFDWYYEAQLAPRIDETDVKQSIQNKSIAYTKEFLGNLPNVASVVVVVKPEPLALFGRMPLRAKNITIETAIAP